MSSSHRRSRFRARVPDEDPIAADAEAGSRSSTENSMDPGEYEADLESMTGKGIKRLCSELIELKRVSDEDFQRNVYSNYSAFVRIFEEIGGVENEIMELKTHTLTQVKLIQAIMSNFYADKVDGLKETKVEDLGLSSSSTFGIHMQDILVTLDILLSECQLKEALILLEKETLTLQKLQIEEDLSSPIIMSYTYALSERRTRLADQLVIMAEHPRVSQPELQKALLGLCRLGENLRANSLLLKFYRSRIQKKVNEFQCSKPCPYGTHIKELAKVVFSAISQAARSFVALYGETSPYSSMLILWAREETETFSRNFCTYVRSVLEMNGSLSLAIEAAKGAVSLCSLLKPQRIVLLSSLMEMITPCMEEALQMHVHHFRKVVHIFTTTDNWVLGKFLSMAILQDQGSLIGIGDKVEYCLLTSSGRKFVTLMQAIADDISPLVILRMGTSILKGLADLFSEYMRALERAIPTKGNAMEDDSPKVSYAQTLRQQLSVLANASTLVHFFPSIARNILKGFKSTNDDLLSEQTEIFSQKQLDDWILSIEEAADQLRCYFVQQFVFGIMSHGDFESATSLDGWLIPSSLQDPVPSFAFQVLLVRLRQLEELSKSIFVGEHGMMENLPKEIVETVIIWLSNNQGFWTKTAERSCMQHCSCFEQVYLDMHFLMEIAVLGRYCSKDLIAGARDLIEEMEMTLTDAGSGPNGVVLEGDWAANAAKLAIKKLLETKAANLGSDGEPVVTFLEESGKERCKDECTSDAEESVHILGGSEDLQDNELDIVVENVKRLIMIKDTIPKSSEGWVSDVISDNYDDDESRSPTIPYSDREDREDADRAGTGTICLSESQDMGELELERLGVKAEVQSVTNLEDFNATEGQALAEGPHIIEDHENELLEDGMLRRLETIEELGAPANPEGESVGSLDESNDIAVKLLTEDQQDISKEELVVIALNLPQKVTATNLLEAGRLEEAVCTTVLVAGDPTAYPEMKSVSNLQESDVITSQPDLGELRDVARKGHQLLETNLLHADSLSKPKNKEGLTIGVFTAFLEGVESVDKLDDGDDAIADQTGIDEPDYSIEEVRPLIKTNLVESNYDLNIVSHDSKPRTSAKLDKLGRDDASGLEREPALLELQSIENGDNQPSDNFSRLILATDPPMLGEDGAALVHDNGKASGGSGTQKEVKWRNRIAAWGTNGIDSRISSDVNNPSDVLVRTTRLELAKESVILEDNTTGSSTMLKDLHVEGEQTLLEFHSNMAEIELPNTSSPELVRIEGSGSISRDTLLQKSEIVQYQAVSAAQANENHLDGTNAKSLSEMKKIDLLEADDDSKLHANGSLAKDGTANDDKSLNKEEEDNRLSIKFSELAIKTSRQKRGSDRSSPAGGSGNTSGDAALRRKGGRKRTKSSAEENAGKSGKAAKALRPRWN